jgi:hypothetical protein
MAQPATTPATRPPVPPSAKIVEAEKLVKDLFKADYAKKKAADHIELAKRLLTAADETKDDPATQYVMYREARELAAKSGDVVMALEAADRIAGAFAVNPAEAKLVALELADKSSVPGLAIIEAALAAIDDAVRVDDYASAARLVKLATGAAGRTKASGIGALMASRAKEIEATRKVFERLASERKILASTPNDPIAASRVGRFLCLNKGDWAAGLLLLAKGEDEKLKEVADKELARPSTTKGKLEIADLWYKLADGLDSVEKPEAKLRAYDWYQQIVKEVTGLDKVRVDNRVAELAKMSDQKAERVRGNFWMVIFRSDDPTIWNTATNRGKDQFAIPLDTVPSRIRYLKMMDIKKKNQVIIEMANSRLTEQIEQDGYGWNGTNMPQFGANHLGIYNVEPIVTTRGLIAIFTRAGLGDYRGWGFGHVVIFANRQGFSWTGVPVEKTIFEIAVKFTALTPDETKTLLKKTK